MVKYLKMQISFLKNKKFYKALFTDSSIPVILTDINDRIIDANKSICRMYGYTHDELIAMTFRDIVSLPSPHEGRSIVLAEKRKYSPSTFETENICKNGEIIPVEVTVLPVKDPEGSLCFSIIRDISKRKEVEKKLIQSEEWYRSVFENAGVSIWEEDFCEVKNELDKLAASGITDLYRYFDEHPEFIQMALTKIKIIDINNETLKLLKAETKEQVLGSLEVIFNRNELNVIKEELVALAEGREEFISEINAFTFKGDLITALLNIRFPREKEALKHTIVSMMDITKLKEAEASLKTALEEKKVLLKELYHRTKNNMQMVGSLLSLQSAYTDNSEVLEVFDDMKNRIQSMSTVHEKLYQSETLSSIHLNDYIDDIIITLQGSYLCPEKQVVIEKKMDNVAVSIEKAIPCGIILNEILTNIFKHAFPDSRKGKIKVVMKELPTGTIHLEIGDNGIGVPEGFDFKDHDSLGMRLIFSIAEEQLKGSIKYNVKKGVIWYLDFPA